MKEFKGDIFIISELRKEYDEVNYEIRTVTTDKEFANKHFENIIAGIPEFFKVNTVEKKEEFGRRRYRAAKNDQNYIELKLSVF